MEWHGNFPCTTMFHTMIYNYSEIFRFYIEKKSRNLQQCQQSKAITLSIIGWFTVGSIDCLE